MVIDCFEHFFLTVCCNTLSNNYLQLSVADQSRGAICYTFFPASLKKNGFACNITKGNLSFILISCQKIPRR